ncbi:MAG: hypothetical protein JWQ64_1018 [Subtercola sp.]|nr:hypothetical protein [Subtercola sp.]
MSAELAWAIKASFVRYVGSAGGNISVAPPTEWVNGRFVFPLADRCPTEGGVKLTFDGEVALSAYDGLLDVQIADLTVLLDGEGGVVSAARLDRSQRYDLAHLTRRAPAGADIPVGFDAVLPESAVGLFGDVYPAGTLLDPLFLTRDSFE